MIDIATDTEIWIYFSKEIKEEPEVARIQSFHFHLAVFRKRIELYRDGYRTILFI